MANNNRLGELLVREKLISLTQLRHAQDEQQKSGNNLGYTLAKLGYVSDDEITSFLSQQYRVPTINLEEYEVDADVLKLVPKEPCERHKVLPVSRTGNSLIVAMADPTNLNAIDDLKFLTGYNIEPVIASETSIHTAIEKYYNAGPSYDEVMAGFDEAEIEFTGDEDDPINLLELEKASEDAPVVRLVNMMLLNAIKKGASDIHIEPYEKKFRVRYRIDGVLAEEMTPPLKLRNAIIEPHQDHGVARHRRAAPAAGRAHQAQARQGPRDGLPRLGRCRRCGARRSSCGCSTRATCSST